MKSVIQKAIALLALLLIISTAGCVQFSSDPGGAIEAYFQALISKESDHVTLLSCADWESSAKTDLDSFTAVTAKLEDFSCKVSGTEGEQTLISCKGKIIANYGNEILEIDMSERTYLAKYEAGEWRMCGYR